MPLLVPLALPAATCCFRPIDIAGPARCIRPFDAEIPAPLWIIICSMPKICYFWAWIRIQ